MTVQEWIDELNEIKNKDAEVKFIADKIVEDMVVVDRIECCDSYDIWLEFEYKEKTNG